MSTLRYESSVGNDINNARSLYYGGGKVGGRLLGGYPTPISVYV